jgi:hypothetical protein
MPVDPISVAAMEPCEWCEKKSDRLTPVRDWEEYGSFSPRFYEVCPDCVKKEKEGFEAASAEWAAYMEPGTPPPQDDDRHLTSAVRMGGGGPPNDRKS